MKEPCHVCDHPERFHEAEGCAWFNDDLYAEPCSCPGYTVAVYGVSGHTHQRGDQSSGHV